MEKKKDKVLLLKRVKAAYIFQTLVFSQKPEMGFPGDRVLKMNYEHYKATPDQAGTRYQITGTEEQEDGSVIVYVRKQYNDRTDVNEYFV